MILLQKNKQLIKENFTISISFRRLVEYNPLKGKEKVKSSKLFSFSVYQYISIILLIPSVLNMFWNSFLYNKKESLCISLVKTKVILFDIIKNVLEKDEDGTLDFDIDTVFLQNGRVVV